MILLEENIQLLEKNNVKETKKLPQATILEHHSLLQAMLLKFIICFFM